MHQCLWKLLIIPFNNSESMNTISLYVWIETLYAERTMLDVRNVASNMHLNLTKVQIMKVVQKNPAKINN